MTHIEFSSAISSNYPSDSQCAPYSAFDSRDLGVLEGVDQQLSDGVTPRCLHEWFEAQVDATPEAIALSFKGETLTYQELNERANQLAHFLLAQGLQPQELVAISMHRSFEMAIGFWGVLKAGGAYVPIDPTYPQERQEYMLQDSQARFLLTQQHLVSSLPNLSTAVTVVCLDSDRALIDSYDRGNPSLPATPEQPAYVIYTSGSTGNPKGVKIAHRGVVNHSLAMTQEFELDASDRMLQFSSISFDIIVEEFFPTLMHGATLVLRTEEISTSIRKFLEFVETHQITILDLPTAFWHELVNGLALLKLPMPSSVRLVVVGGEKASRVVYAEWVKLVGHHPRWLNTYGPTETTVTATVYDPIRSQYNPDQGEIPIGKPIANAEVYILSPELKQVPFGEVGELHIGGPGLAIGYHQLPTRTADKFIPNPFSDDPQSRLYKTGDTVRYLPDGNLEFVGRIDFQVKLRGYRIELGEIENCLEQHPSIQQAIVIAREDVPGDKYLVGYLAAKADAMLNVSDICDFLKQKLPEYMVPTAFVEMETFPLTPNGKVDRKALPAPSTVDRSESKIVVAPSNSVETKLLHIWESILGIPNISITDNFFELGGHSLLVARLIDWVAVEFDVNLPLSTLIQAPTIEQLATVLTSSDTLDSLTIIRPGGAKEPVFFIHDGDGETMLYRTLAFHLDPERPIYGIQPYADRQRPILHTRIEDMAAHYLEQIRLVQPEGPYWLAGMCAGGVIAYEIARQMQAKGLSVHMVALLDAAEPHAEGRTGFIANQRLNRMSDLLRQYSNENLPRRLVKVGAGVARKVWKTASYEVTTVLKRQVNDLKLQAFRFYLDRQLIPPLLISPVSVRKTYVFAERAYNPATPFEGEMLLFRATEGVGDDQPYQEIYADPMLGWQSRATQGVRVYDIPGGHSSMLQEPHVRVMAELMQAYLDRPVSSLNTVSAVTSSASR